jgi:hypothetical protein
VVFTWGCQSQWYMNLWGPSINEALLLLPESAALASFGPAGVTSPAAQQPFYLRFYENLSQAPGLSLGELILLAKRDALTDVPESRTAVEGFNLLGDPSLVIPVVPEP